MGDAGHQPTIPAHRSVRPSTTHDPLARLRALCLALPDVLEKPSHGEPTFWVRGRMFATFANADNHHGAGRHAVWCKATPITQDVLTRDAPNRYFVPPYVGPTGWVGVYLNARPPWAQIAALLRDAHQLAAASPATRSTRTRGAPRSPGASNER